MPLKKPPGRPKPVKNAKTGVTSVKHKDKRTNIPTQELRDFVAEAETRPKTVLYPRDPSLDPQLVWKGKDEQDQQSLTVPAVPVYIQEKIHPQAIIEELRARSASGAEPPLELFADFNGIAFEQLVDFYHHEQNWANRMILGDSLLVMTSLAEKEGLKGKVQTIYFDPPYGIKFGSNWQVSTRKRDVRDGKVEDATRQPEQIRAFRDTWKLGIHSYLAYMRDRLMAARDLLTETGSLFVQMGDENIHLVRAVLDEVFGSEDFVALISFKKTGYQASALLPSNFDFILWYAKHRDQVKFRQLHVSKLTSSAFVGQDLWLELLDGTRRRLSSEESEDLESVPDGGRVFRHKLAESAGAASVRQPFEFHGRTFEPKDGKHWSTTIDGLRRLVVANRLMVIGKSLRYVNYLADFPVTPLTTNWTDTVVSGFSDPQRYVVQTSLKVVERCVLMTTDPGDLVLDPTCGSGTTAVAAEQWGRRWITIDTSRVALALARTRLMAARYPYYLLADSPEGLRKGAEITGRVPPEHRTDGDIRKGFVYERVPHVMLKSIANNPDIREGMSREQIDAAIARHAETEILFDRPYEDSKRIRVSGPFTVESLSPHRVLATDDEHPGSETSQHDGGPPFETTILENLKKAGVQNTFKNERLVFERIEPFAGTWIHAQGFYTDKLGGSKRVAISIGPEHGTVGPEQLKEAAKESIKGVGFDMIVVCGFAFDPHVYETAKQIEPDATAGDGTRKVAEPGTQYGRLPVLLARMNPDLLNDDLLKKTGAGNLFMVFGEPEIKLDREKDGKWTVTLKGLDVYDPTTGEVRNSSTDDIACWFIDTDYNGESFFVRHAYFTGAEEPYERLQRALRAEIDEAAWSTLYSTKSRPFEQPKSGKVAIKVINHYGDEVLKVVELVSGRK
ncbi:MAG TPA: site-specific DNA-methyltransferase [Candidatus Eisenbacteria bacterium]|nr:site-specific DNA-methyltransferase [Candidatus Eisenbacteria bacterium]